MSSISTRNNRRLDIISAAKQVANNPSAGNIALLQRAVKRLAETDGNWREPTDDELFAEHEALDEAGLES